MLAFCWLTLSEQSGRFFNVSSNGLCSNIILKYPFPGGVVLKQRWVSLWHNFISQYPNRHTINWYHWHGSRFSERSESTFESQKLYITEALSTVSKLGEPMVSERITPLSFDSSTSVAPAFDTMDSVLSLLWIVHSTLMFSNSSGVWYWDLAVLAAEHLGYFFKSVDFKSWERNNVVGKVVLEELSYEMKPERCLNACTCGQFWAKEDRICQNY